jgi:Nif-specific regulatory protein
MAACSSEPSALERFYQRLLALRSHAEIEPLLDDALQLIVEITRAQLAYLEFFSENEQAPAIWRGHAVSAATIEEIRSRISRGILGKAIAEGRTIETASAVDDPRFSDLESVRQRERGAAVLRASLVSA